MEQHSIADCTMCFFIGILRRTTKKRSQFWLKQTSEPTLPLRPCSWVCREASFLPIFTFHLSFCFALFFIRIYSLLRSMPCLDCCYIIPIKRHSFWLSDDFSRSSAAEISRTKANLFRLGGYFPGLAVLFPDPTLDFLEPSNLLGWAATLFNPTWLFLAGLRLFLT